MGYTLRTGITTGRIDCDLGTFEIRDRTLKCDDYETARLLVRNQQYGVSWPDGDPGPPEDEAEAEAEAEAEDEDSEEDVDEAEPELEDEPSSESEAVEDEDEEADAEADAEAEEEVERDDEGREIHTCAGMGGDCTRRVDEPGGLCWQHEDQG